MLFDVKKGNNLMLTGLTSVATLLERHWVRFALNEAWHCVCVCVMMINLLPHWIALLRPALGCWVLLSSFLIVYLWRKQCYPMTC